MTDWVGRGQYHQGGAGGSPVEVFGGERPRRTLDPDLTSI